MPYGVYDVAANEAFVSVGITADTAEFAVATIRTWLERMGRWRYPKMRKLTIMVDCGGSVRACGCGRSNWRSSPTRRACRSTSTTIRRSPRSGTGSSIVCSATSRWRGRPLSDRLAVVELIGTTTTETGLKVQCLLDQRTYEKDIKVSDAEMAALDITGDAFHPERKLHHQAETPADDVAAIIERVLRRPALREDRADQGRAAGSDALRVCHWTISLRKRWLLGTHAVGRSQAFAGPSRRVRFPSQPAHDQRR